MSAWLHIVGIGEDGLDGLLPAGPCCRTISGGDYWR
jgi:hypothetical protein